MSFSARSGILKRMLPRLAGLLRLATCVLAVLAQVQAAPAPRQRADEEPCRADYQIQARYEEAERRIVGRALVRYVNRTRDTIPDLQFHLYWNAFASTRSTHLAPGGGTTRGGVVKDGEFGWTRLTSVVVGADELVGGLEHIAPDDGNPDDRTVARVRLKQPIKPGAEQMVELRWEARMPRVRRRTGHKDDFLFAAHWFPKLGVWEAGNGWNCHQFHASTEFYANYGWYDVELDLPRKYEGKVGASGVQEGPARVAGDRVVTRFLAPGSADRGVPDRLGKAPLLHDFAWTADPDFVVVKNTFHWDEWAARFPEEVDRTALALGRAKEDVRARDVDVTVLIQPERLAQAGRHFDATCTALFFYGLWWGEYPYAHITCVDPAWGGGAAGGMEYPTLFTAGTDLWARSIQQTPESVTVHEAGHQFWHGLVGNNEFEAAWLDEGFNTFTQNDALWLRYGASARTTRYSGFHHDGVHLVRGPGGGRLADALALERAPLPWLGVVELLPATDILRWWRDQPLLSSSISRVDPRHSERNGYLLDPDTDPIDRHGWLYADATSYRVNSYRRTANALRSLEGLVGSERFLRGMRRHSEEWRLDHPYPDDFFRSFQQGAEVDVQWYFDQVFRSTATVDWQLSVAERRIEATRGHVVDAAGRFVDAPAPGKDEKPRWRPEILVKRKGALLLPLEVELRFEDGHVARRAWTREEQERGTWWKPIKPDESRESRLVSVVLDPDRRWTFDMDLSDNEWHAKRDEAAPLRHAERTFAHWTQILHWIGGLGG